MRLMLVYLVWFGVSVPVFAAPTSATQKQKDIMVEAQVTDGTFKCDGAGYLILDRFKILGDIPVKLSPLDLRSQGPVGSQQACWRKAIQLSDKYNGQTIHIPGSAQIKYEIEWVDYGTKGYYIDVHQSQVLATLEDVVLTGGHICSSRTYSNECGI
jgi:hypothetical protein